LASIGASVRAFWRENRRRDGPRSVRPEDGPSSIPTYSVGFRPDPGAGQQDRSVAGLEGLFDLSQFVALGAHPAEELLVEGPGPSGASAEDPEIGPGGVADDRPPVVLVEIDDPVIPEKGQKKLTLSLALVVLSTIQALPRTLLDLPSSVSLRQTLTTSILPSARSE